ncbi:MAG: elongation factor P maturation arginine rhamnosyltransferase EarP [Rubrivivax sp.]|nr:elongation factor P maturation arginine rhamnosyltransferase EarP [Rubrivivax sp.]
MAGQQWDIFCRVVDNYGDAGVCWRLARTLAASGQVVRLIIDDAEPLRWMAPRGTPGVQVLPWPGPAQPGDVVIEAFGCDPPQTFVASMAARAKPPVWINLEYLSAEPYVERSHGLPSPQPNGLTKWFYFPGFTARTGGLLRDGGVAPGFDGRGWLASQGWTPLPGERVVSLFCYDNPALPDLLQSLAARPTLLLLTPGFAQAQVRAAAPTVRLVALPWLDQEGYDALLAACDINFVRGEDSLLRALWAGVPMVWQAYPQHDGAHFAKLAAVLAQWQAPPDVAALWQAWNGWPGQTWPGWPDTARWATTQRAWRTRLLAQDDLATQLLGFVSGKARATC